jgi:hypothetical protein
MTPRPTLRLVFLAAALTCLLGACGDDKKGACVPRASPLACGDDFTSGQCDTVNGDFYPGKTCAEIGH